MVSLTTAAVDELAAISPTRPAIRAAQLATTLRCVSELDNSSGRPVIYGEVTRASVAHRIRADIALLYGYTAEIVEHRRDGGDAAGRYSLRVVDNAVMLAHQVGLIDRHGHPVRGLPARVVAGSVGEVGGVWRGAFLAGGEIAEPRRGSLIVTCPTWEVAVALSGAARRLAVTAKARDGHRGNQVVIRGGDDVSALLDRLGATNTRTRFEELRARAHTQYAAARLFPGHSQEHIAGFSGGGHGPHSGHQRRTGRIRQHPGSERRRRRIVRGQQYSWTARGRVAERQGRLEHGDAQGRRVPPEDRWPGGIHRQIHAVILVNRTVYQPLPTPS